jgi:hypothetical protein
MEFGDPLAVGGCPDGYENIFAILRYGIAKCDI